MTARHGWPESGPSLRWHHPSPGTFARRLEELGCAVEWRRADGAVVVVALRGGRLELTRAAVARAERREVARDIRPRPPERLQSASATLAGIALGTVDLERWLRDSPMPGLGADVTDDVLGGKGFISEFADPALIVLEPIRDGRLAAALARFDEGPVALYVRPGGGYSEADSRAAGEPSDAGDGPLGKSVRLDPPSRPWGPFLFVVEAN